MKTRLLSGVDPVLPADFLPAGGLSAPAASVPSFVTALPPGRVGGAGGVPGGESHVSSPDSRRRGRVRHPSRTTTPHLSLGASPSPADGPRTSHTAASGTVSGFPGEGNPTPIG
jgi:hypothetical protein